MFRAPHRGHARLFYPDTREVQFRLANESVHEPKNPSPDVLPPDARAFWGNVADQAADIYGPHADEHSIPEKTAWKAVRMHWMDGGGMWVPRQESAYELPYVLPNVGDVAHLGHLIEYAWITPEGEVVKRSFPGPNPPDVWWSDEQKTLYAFPNTKVPDYCLLIPEDMEDTAHTFKRWSQRDATCNKIIDVPTVRMYPRGAGDSVSYRSDKWHEENPEAGQQGSPEYIHLHGDGVWVWEDTRDLEATPNAIMIRGGRLDVEERGIIH